MCVKVEPISFILFQFRFSIFLFSYIFHKIHICKNACCLIHSYYSISCCCFFINKIEVKKRKSVFSFSLLSQHTQAERYTQIRGNGRAERGIHTTKRSFYLLIKRRKLDCNQIQNINNNCLNHKKVKRAQLKFGKRIQTSEQS